MKIRQYTAATMQEAVLKIKGDLGPDAVILHTRKIFKGGFLGFFRKELLEVLAAIDPEREPRPTPQPVGAAAGAGRHGVEASAKAEAARPARPAMPMPAMPAMAPAGWPSPPPAGWPAQFPPGWPRPDEDSTQAAAMPARREASAGPGILERPSTPERTPLSPRLETPARQETSARDLSDRLATSARRGAPATPKSPQEATEGAEREGGELAIEVSALRSTLGELKGMIEGVVTRLEPTPPVPSSMAELRAPLQRLYSRMIEADLSVSIANGLIAFLEKEHADVEAYEDLVEALALPLAELFETTGPLVPRTGLQKVVALVGPTGVGKTTTIAKLAAGFALPQTARVSLLTIDTFRVAAVEQLKTYGDIIGLPVEVVLTPQRMKDVLSSDCHQELVLIDTAGRSPLNRMHLNELRGFLDFKPDRETYLVLSATTRLADLRKIVRNFLHTGVDRLIFTKLDETHALGGLLSIAHETGLPIAYLTTGQNVPDDILVADREKLARRLVKELKR